MKELKEMKDPSFLKIKMKELKEMKEDADLCNIIGMSNCLSVASMVF